MRRTRGMAVALATIWLCGSAAAVSDGGWQEVEKALSQGLPRTAAAALDSIARAALRRNDHPEAARAIAQRIAVESAIQGHRPEERILALQAELERTPAQTRPVLEAILARWYWQYFQENRWRFMQRSTTATPPSDDLLTWDLPRIYAEIDEHFQRALSASALLRREPIARWDGLIARGNVPDAYRPTLYDFIAFEALAFYASGEQAGAKPEDAFEIDAQGPIFDDATSFLRWRPATSDSTSPHLRAIRLFQEVMAFHARDAHPAARIDVDLERLRFGSNYAVGAAKDERYRRALQRVAERDQDHEASALARAEWASQVSSAGDRVEARRIARVGAERFPDSPGGRACHNLIQVLESPLLNIQTERVWSTPAPTIGLQYRNLERVYFRLVPVDFEEWLGNRRETIEYQIASRLDSLLRLEPAREWTATVPATLDLRERVEHTPSPRGLRSGMYILLASDSPRFAHDRHTVQGTVIWISELALVMSGRRAGGDGLVLDALSGAPIPGANVRWWTERRRRPGGSTRTGTDGRFRVPPQHGPAWLIVTHKDQRLGIEDFFGGQRDPRPSYERTVFFTDRAIYRPGQRVRYKGICIEVDTEGDDYAAIARRPVTVVFRDPNGKEIAREEHRTNEYGSFNGSFVTPGDRLLGAMHLAVQEGPSGDTRVRVEEYKRPKFHVTVDPPTDARLDGPVAISGVATAYTGAAVDGARVRWQVTRQVRYPIWCWWFWRHPPRQAAQQIAHGVTTTGVDGRFRIVFPARPDRSVKPENEPTFSFSVVADVTDPAGETRSGSRVVNIGYTALRAEITAEEWQTSSQPVEITVRTTTHDGTPVAASGRLIVHRLRQPGRVERPPLGPDPDWGSYDVEEGRDVAVDSSDPRAWPDGEEVIAQAVATDSSGTVRVTVPLAAGAYRARVETQDRFGRSVKALLPIRMLDPGSSQCAIRVPDLLAAPRWSWEPGQEFVALWGSGYEPVRAYVEIEHRGRTLQAYWTAHGANQFAIRQRVTEQMRGGFTLRITMVREGRAYLHERRIDVPWSNQRLALRWEHFVSKLGPAQRETWTAVVRGPDAAPAAAELVATLYDASLDAFAPHGWPAGFNVFRTDYDPLGRRFMSHPLNLHRIAGDWDRPSKDASRVHRRFHPQVLWDWWGHGGRLWFAKSSGDGLRFELPPPVRGGRTREVKRFHGVLGPGGANALTRLVSSELAVAPPESPAEVTAPPPPLDQVVARRNLEETAFFFPDLVSDENGEVRMTFTMPEALTEWRFLGFAHDAHLRSGLLEGRAVTAKDLMVQPNPPRFLREGDVIEFTVRVTNLSDARQTGRVRLGLTHAADQRPADADYKNREPERSLEIPARESRTYAWRLEVPDGAGVIAYRAVASTSTLSDGEEAFLPVLSRSVLVTESLPLPIRGPRSRDFDFARLRNASASSTLRHQSLAVQMVSNPSWYAVMALPYLMEYPFHCTEQIFNRLYANALGHHIVASDPRIRRVFEQWRGTPALDSPLEKNQDLQAVLLEETPWLRQAKAESQARRDVGVLFDGNRLERERAAAERRLAEAQLPDGAWPWFPGGPADDYLTLYITTGFGRLRHLGARDIQVAMALRALDHLDRWADGLYRDILERGTKQENHLSPTIALYLYGRSFFLRDRLVVAERREALDYWQAQARAHWLTLPSRQSQGHVALALMRFGDVKTPAAIVRSLRERSVQSEELGMFWRDEERSWWWHRAPIETQAIMIETFDEVEHDSTSVEECRVWLLKQKQTQDWKTTKATADAVYALLLRGRDVLASEDLVEVALGGVTIRPAQVEAGTGFYERRFAAPEIVPALATVSVRKRDRGVAWGSIHWQYFEDMDKVTAYAGTPLTLRKALFTRRHTPRGPVIEPVKGTVGVGDELVVRLELRVDRDMEYVHLKDYRGSGVEPVNVLSGFRHQDGLGYYEQTRDVASHFFIHYLPKGTYVFEYPVRVQHRGRYQTGFAQIQCMYAPEFNSHSEGFALEVR